MRHRELPARGFALVIMLAFAAITAMLAAAAMQEALFGQTLAGSRQLHLRATLLAQRGLEEGFWALRTGSMAPGATRELQPLPLPDHSVLLTLRELGQTAPPPGYSLDHFTGRAVAIESTGRAPRGAVARFAQGVTQVQRLQAASP
jgi:Tfp pilus assembly protein PilX